MPKIRSSWLQCAIAIAVMIGVWTLARAQQKADDVKYVDGEAFRLLDKNGKVRGIWTVANDESVLFFLDGNQKELLRITGSKMAMGTGEPGVIELDWSKECRLSLASKDSGKGGCQISHDGIRLADRSGKVRVGMIQSLLDPTPGFIVALDPQGKPVFTSQ
jgi:hypothetical protein